MHGKIGKFFRQLNLFLGPKTTRMVGMIFKNYLKDNSGKVCFVSLGHLIVFISRLDSLFIKTKTTKKYFFQDFLIYLYREKGIFSNIPHLENSHEAFYMDPVKNVEKSRWWYFMKNKCRDTAGPAYGRKVRNPNAHS